jgi:hypothetical protein
VDRLSAGLLGVLALIEGQAQHEAQAAAVGQGR